MQMQTLSRGSARRAAVPIAAAAVGVALVTSPGAAQTAPVAPGTASPLRMERPVAATLAGDSARPTAAALIRPFRVAVPATELADLRRRLVATRRPGRETVPDRSQGPPLAELQTLVRYRSTDYDWRKAEAKLSALPQFMTTIAGVDIHWRAWARPALPTLAYFSEADRGGAKLIHFVGVQV